MTTMDGDQFFDCLSTIVGRTNAALYATRFGDLDATFFEELRNYEGLAFYAYTTSMNWHQTINRELWSGQPSVAVAVFTEVLNDALSKLTIYVSNNGTVFRGYRAEDLVAFLADYTLGTTRVFRGFTSAAYAEAAAFGGNVLFIIRSLTARSVWHVSANFGEHEILIPAGRSFLVIGVQTRNGRAVINMEEQP